MIIEKLSMDMITYGLVHSSFIKLIDHHCIKLCAIIQWKKTCNEKVRTYAIGQQHMTKTLERIE